MRNLIVAAGGSLLLAAPFAHADVVGLGASVSYWDSELTGEAADKSGGEVDVENDLDLENDSNTNASLYFEHPVPVLPNVRLNYTLVQQSGRGELGANFGGIDVASGVDVQSELTWNNLILRFTTKCLITGSIWILA